VIAVRSGGMITILSALVSVLSFRFRSRASLELELVALRHQLIVFRRQPPRSPWQNPYVERIVGSIRRDYLDHVIIFNETHLRRVLSCYFRERNASVAK
jgi:Integrase core domain